MKRNDTPDFVTLYFDEVTTDPVPNTVISTDLEPAITYDHVSRLVTNFQKFREILGLTSMRPMAAGNVIRRYKTTVTKGAKQPEEGAVIPLTKVERKPLDPIVLELNPIRKLTTAQAIQRVGSAIAVEETDAALEREAIKDVREDFFNMLTAPGYTSADSGSGLQMACAQAQAKAGEYFEDVGADMIFFLNNYDVATYLGNAHITLQSAFGLRYLENFLGLGTAIVSPRVPKGKVFCTAVQNLNGVYIGQGGDVATMFGLTYDSTGMIGITHNRATDRASIETLLMYGVKFYTEDASGVIVSEIVAG